MDYDKFKDRMLKGCKTSDCVAAKALVEISWNMGLISERLLNIYMKMK